MFICDSPVYHVQMIYTTNTLYKYFKYLYLLYIYIYLEYLQMHCIIADRRWRHTYKITHTMLFLFFIVQMYHI